MNSTKGDNTPTNTLEEILNTIYATEEWGESVVDKDSLEEAREKIEALISQAVNKAKS